MKIVTIILPWTLIRPNIIQASTEASKCSFLANIFSPRDKRRFYYWYDLHACATEGTKFLVKSVCEKAPCSWLPPVVRGFESHHDWPINKAVVDLPIRLTGNSKRTCGNPLSRWGSPEQEYRCYFAEVTNPVRLHTMKIMWTAKLHVYIKIRSSQW